MGFWRCWGAGGLEVVAHPGFGENIFRLGRVGFDLFAELVDDNAEVFGFFAVVGTPDGLQEATVCQGFAFVGDEELKTSNSFGVR